MEIKKGVLCSCARVGIAHARCSVCMCSRVHALGSLHSPVCSLLCASVFARIAGTAVWALARFRVRALDSLGARARLCHYHHMYTCTCPRLCVHVL